jgi:hypothetical protein
VLGCAFELEMAVFQVIPDKFWNCPTGVHQRAIPEDASFKTIAVELHLFSFKTPACIMHLDSPSLTIPRDTDRRLRSDDAPTVESEALGSPSEWLTPSGFPSAFPQTVRSGKSRTEGAGFSAVR